MSTDNLITNTRRKRSKSFPPSSSTPLPVQDSSSNTVVSLNRSLLRTDTGKIDASILSVEQMQYMSECEKHMYEKLDFTRCKDDVIYDVVFNGVIINTVKTCSYIPSKYRKSPKLVRDFVRLSKKDRERTKLEDFDHFFNPTDTQNVNATDRQCMYLTRSIMKIGSKNVTWNQEEEEGYDSLIRTSIYQKGQRLKENKYEKHGILDSNDLILRELYSGPLPKGISEYIRYAFSARTCTSPSEGKLICSNCP